MAFASWRALPVPPRGAQQPPPFKLPAIMRERRPQPMKRKRWKTTSKSRARKQDYREIKTSPPAASNAAAI
jgi:hypothetical protein